MELIFKIIAIGLLVLLFTSCQRKKPQPLTLSDWLEKNYPDRFIILGTETKDAIRNLSFKVKESVVAEKADTMVQALISWDKRQPDLLLSTEAVTRFFANAANEMQDAKTLFQLLKSSGFNNIAASIYDKAAVVLVFDEPTPEHRQAYLVRLEKALKNWPPATNYDKALTFMEPETYGKYFQDIVPLSFWVQSNELYMQQMLFRLFCPYDRPFIATDLEQDWTFNIDSHRFKRYFEKAQNAATAWAQQHLKSSYTFLDQVEYIQTPDSPALLSFKFPFVDTPSDTESSKDSESGYIDVDFNIDLQSFQVSSSFNQNN